MIKKNLQLLSNKNPRLVIITNPILEEVFMVYVKNAEEYKNTEWKDWKPWNKEALLKNLLACKEEWGKHEAKILRSISETLGLHFSKNEIVVHVTSANPRNISDPLIIRGTQNPDSFLISLTHELIHEIIQYNNKKINIRKVREHVLGYTNKEKSETTLDHVVVYAALENILKNDLNRNDLWELCLKKTSTNKDYSEACKIVETRGHAQILADIKNIS